MNNAVFEPADLLLYQGNDPSAFSVIACDQHTSEPSYWEQVQKCAGEKPSALHLIFPEVFLKTADFTKTIASINQNMTDYLKNGVFAEYKDSLIYVERTLANGKIRRGIVGKIDLESYQFEKNAQTPIRATEETVLSRIPPRVTIRENAPLEISHAMLLIDDLQKSVIEPLSRSKDRFPIAYSFPLMQKSGFLRGWFLPKEEQKAVLSALEKLSTPESFYQKYGQYNGFSFAIGDGNHSLAAAKQCYLKQKAELGEKAALKLPSRYALCEIVNLYDDSLTFEAIHRVLFDVDPQKVLQSLSYCCCSPSSPDATCIRVVIGESVQSVSLSTNGTLSLKVLQDFCDKYIAANGGRIDYIHGEDVVQKLCKEKDDRIGFLLSPIDKKDLFRHVLQNGSLPRKTFSMGEAADKRFYYEARKLR